MKRLSPTMNIINESSSVLKVYKILRQINLSTIKMSDRALSQIQKHFQTHSIYKRSKRYLDIQKLNHLQKSQEIIRRKPNYSKETLDTRVDYSFVNNDELYQQKRAYDINRFRQTFLNLDDESVISTDASMYYSRPVHVRKSFDMDKMSSREYEIKRNSPKNITMNQDRFKNFRFTRFQPKLAVNFEREVNREQVNLNHSTKQIQNLSEINNSVPMANKIKYNNAAFRCLLDYEKMSSEKLAKPAVSPKAVSLDRMDKAHNFSTPFKATGIHSFYSTIGKEIPGQMDLKVKKGDQFYFNSRRDQLKKLDFTDIKRKEDMVVKRLQQIRENRKFVNDREEMCDQKYFRRVNKSGLNPEA